MVDSAETTECGVKGMPMTVLLDGSHHVGLASPEPKEVQRIFSRVGIRSARSAVIMFLVNL